MAKARWRPRIVRGQVWADCDPRRAERELEVVQNPRYEDFVVVENRQTGRRTSVSRGRFDGSTRGYTFVR